MSKLQIDLDNVSGLMQLTNEKGVVKNDYIVKRAALLSGSYPNLGTLPPVVRFITPLYFRDSKPSFFYIGVEGRPTFKSKTITAAKKKPKVQDIPIPWYTVICKCKVTSPHKISRGNLTISSVQIEQAHIVYHRLPISSEFDYISGNLFFPYFLSQMEITSYPEVNDAIEKDDLFSFVYAKMMSAYWAVAAKDTEEYLYSSPKYLEQLCDFLSVPVTGKVTPTSFLDVLSENPKEELKKILDIPLYPLSDDDIWNIFSEVLSEKIPHPVARILNYPLDLRNLFKGIK